MKQIVFLDRGTIAPQIVLEKPDFAHNWVEYQQTSPDKVIERAADADVVVTNKVHLRKETLDKLPNLKMISVAATGYDVIDVDACHAAGVTVSNVRGYAKNTVPEHTFALILNLRRSISAYSQDVINGEWQKSGQFCFFNHPIKDLAGARLGIIGEGAIGQAVAAVALGFGMEPVFAAHKGVSGLGPLYTPWEEVIKTSDIITLHAPLTASTRHCLSDREFEMMERQPLIINTARGGLVDEKALVSALDSGQIGGFGFDVLSTEPPSPDNPLMLCLDRPNTIVTPHIAWASEEAQTEVWRQTVDHINAWDAGSPKNTL